VAKVNGPTLIEAVEYAADSREVPLDLIEEANERENTRVLQMKTYFGNGHVPNQTRHYRKVPVSREIIDQLYDRYERGRDIPDSVRSFTDVEVKSIVTIQERVEELGDEDRLSVTSGYAERSRFAGREDFKQAYDRTTDTAVLGKEDQIDSEELKKVQSGMRELLDKAERDPRLRESLKEFVTRAIAYSGETGESLDLAGDDNIIFSEKDSGEWNYVLVDALYPSAPPPEDKMEQTKAILAKLDGYNEGDLNPLGPQEQNILMNIVNYVRTINGLANYLGIDERINITPERVDIDSDKIFRAITEEPSSETD
jgi:hypothetical protein